MTAETRFWSQVNKTNTCWLWTAGQTGSGYGAFYPNGREDGQTSAHRYSYTLTGKTIPDNLQIDHLCRTKTCVNPDHLEAVTSHENIRRAQLQDGTGAGTTHCPHGHPYDEANTRHHPNGRRVCRACARNYAAKRRGPRNPPPTHCPQGHEYNNENTYTHHNKRRCNTCHRERERARYRKSRAS